MKSSRPNHELELHGPIEDLKWASVLESRVFTPGLAPRMCGFEFHADLAQHYRFSEIVLTGLRGNPPTRAEGELFDALLSFLAPVSVAEAPTHAAVLSRACGAAAAAVTAVGATILAYQAAELIDRHAQLLQWLESQALPLPAAFRCQADAERATVGAFARRVRSSSIDLPILGHDPSLVAALLAGCYQCGLTDAERLQAVVVIAKLPGLLAETLAAPFGARERYPIDLPHFRYTGDRRSQPPADDDDER